MGEAKRQGGTERGGTAFCTDFVGVLVDLRPTFKMSRVVKVIDTSKTFRWCSKDFHSFTHFVHSCLSQGTVFCRALFDIFFVELNCALSEAHLMLKQN